MEGFIYVGSQESDDPQSGKMFRLFLVVEGQGVRLKLEGAVRADPQTGQLTTTFVNNPQLPFEELEVRLYGGSQAALANPASCGPKTSEIRVTSWSGKTVDSESSFDIDCSPGLGSFDPSFEAGTVTPTAGAFSPFALRIGKPDGQSDLDGLSMRLPQGLLANLKGNVGSQVGTVRAFAGSGSSPFMLSGRVFLEGAYGDAPFSLRAVVPAVAGPFNLGEVVVRQKVYVDPDDASVSVVSDALPTIVKGVPVRLQRLEVDVDKPGFVVNPTSCAAKKVEGTLGAVTGQSAAVTNRFQVGDCASLAFKPKLRMRLTGRKQTRTGGHPALRTVVSQAKGQANIGRAQVALPKSIALDAVNSYDPKLVCDYDQALKADCPTSTVIGKAAAQTPLLDRPLTGSVHLVQGIKFGKSGNRIRTTPALLVKLRGQVAIDLRAKTTVKNNRLVTTFAAVPDAPVSKFDLTINGGRKGILVVTRTVKSKLDLCTARQTASVQTDGHNGKTADYPVRVKTPCKTSARKTRRKR